jgi:putative acetyltransferase
MMSGESAFSIRAMRDEDLAGMVAVRSIPAVARNLLAMPYESVERWRKTRAAAAPGHFLVACADGVVVGHAGIQPSRAARRALAASCGIMVDPAWWGRGVGTALFAALTDLADNWLNLRRLELEVYTDNAPAIALYKKFDFVEEGVLRRDAMREGAFADSYVMARLKGDLPRDAGPYPARPPAAPPTPYSLRAVEPADLEGVAALMNLPGIRHGTLQVPYATPDTARFFTAPDDPVTKGIVAVAGDAVVGLGILVPGKGRRMRAGEILALGVHDAWVGRGIGNALLAAMLDVADNWLGLNRLTLTVLADNTAAVRLYERHGFKPEALKRADVFRAGAYADALAMARFK